MLRDILILCLLLQPLLQVVADDSSESDDEDRNTRGNLETVIRVVTHYFSTASLSTRLADTFDGNTYFWPHIAKNYLSSSGWLTRNQYHVTLRPNIADLFSDRLLVGSLHSWASDIASVALSFRDKDDEIVQNDEGQPLEFVSRVGDVGHVMELMGRDVSYASARFVFTVVPESRFDPRKIFFHFSRPSSSYRQRVTAPTRLRSTRVRSTTSSTISPACTTITATTTVTTTLTTPSRSKEWISSE